MGRRGRETGIAIGFAGIVTGIGTAAAGLLSVAAPVVPVAEIAGVAVTVLPEGLADAEAEAAGEIVELLGLAIADDACDAAAAVVAEIGADSAVVGAAVGADIGGLVVTGGRTPEEFATGVAGNVGVGKVAGVLVVAGLIAA